MRKIVVVKIDLDEKTKKEFVVREMTVEEIIELTQTSSIFGGGPEKVGDSFMGELSVMSSGVSKILDKTCDFTLEDLKPLPPSDIKKIYDGFLEANQSFLKVLDVIGITETAKKIVKAAFSGFSAMPVI